MPKAWRLNVNHVIVVGRTFADIVSFFGFVMRSLLETFAGKWKSKENPTFPTQQDSSQASMFIVGNFWQISIISKSQVRHLWVCS